MLQEVHHRVNNNLQIVSSILRLQSSLLQDKNISTSFSDAVDRIKTIALVHDKIYKSSSVDKVHIIKYIEDLYSDISLQFNIENTPNLTIKDNKIMIYMDSVVPLALILNELFTNSLKYAFKNQPEPKIVIEIDWQQESKSLRLNYKDTGTWQENSDSDHFGTSLIEIFTEQLEGEFELIKEREATQYKFNFKDISISRS